MHVIRSGIAEDKQQVLERLIAQHLPVEDKEDIMRTIAQKKVLSHL